jgi:predicted TIM-barrel fold metal-dependent hydrolase
LIAGGVLERFPRLRVGFMEAGTGWLPYWLDRMDDHFEQLGWLVPDLIMKPSAYFERQCFVSTEPGEPGLSHIVASIGTDHVLFASDFPHFDAVFPGAVDAFVAGCGVDRDVQTKILRTNAIRYLGIAG